MSLIFCVYLLAYVNVHMQVTQKPELGRTAPIFELGELSYAVLVGRTVKWEGQ
jgi:hypothetical protein